MRFWLEYGRGGQRSRYELDAGTAVLGRQRDCTIVLHSEAVSRRHARIDRSDDAATISDLGSRNGTLVNGIRIEHPTRLSDRDVITLCDCELRYRVADADASAPLGSDLQVTMVDGLTDAEILSTMNVATEATAASPVDASAALAAVLRVTRALGDHLALEQVLPRVLDSIFEIYPHADRGVILLTDEEGELVPMASKARYDDGSELRISRTVVSRALAQKQAILSANAAEDSQFDASQSLMAMPIHSLMCVPMLGHEDEPLGVIELHSESANRKFTESCLDLLVSVGNAAAIAVENARLHQVSLQQARLERDLEHARDVQRSFLPSGSPECPGYAFFTDYRAATAVGGDYYGFTELPDGRLAIGVGDVSGKGMPAALMMARLSSDVRFAMLQTGDPAEALALVNRSLAEARLDDRFVTFVLMVLDPVAHRLTFANAGHQPPLLRKADGSVLSLGEGSVGLPLNVSDDPAHQPTPVEVELEPGATVLTYTDGLSEAANGVREMFGDDRVLAVFADERDSASAVGERLLREATEFVAGAPPRDDTTIVCFQRLP